MGGTLKYLASAGDNQVVTAKPALLHRILIGADVAGGVIEVSDHASDGDATLIAKYTGAALMTATGGTIEVGAYCETGITLDLVNQTDVTVVWSPSGVK